MKKLMTVVLMLFILTVFVSGVSAHSERSNTKFTASISQYADAYATSTSADEAHAYSTTYAAAGGSDTQKGKAGFAIGATQAYIDGGSGSQVDSGQTVSGTLF